MTLLLADLPPDFLRICALLMGLLWGSFLNVVIHRVPRGMNLSRPASHCPACEKPIPAYRNIPLVSWLAQRGKAACCGAKISVRYPLIELIGGLLALGLLEVSVLSLPSSTTLAWAAATWVSGLALMLGLTAAAFIDLEHMIIPDSISIGGTVLGIGTFVLRDMTLLDSVIGAAVGFLIAWLPFVFLYGLLRGKPGMGLGDAKLTMLAGAWLGWEGALFVLGFGAIQGTVVMLVLLLLGKPIVEPAAVIEERRVLREELDKLSPEERAEWEQELKADPLADEPEDGWGKQRIAFGPFLILATMECVLVGPHRLVHWITTL